MFTFSLAKGRVCRNMDTKTRSDAILVPEVMVLEIVIFGQILNILEGRINSIS